jgi:hypothetical protein
VAYLIACVQFGVLGHAEHRASMFGWTCTLVTAFPVELVATMREWLVLRDIVDSSHFPVDLEVMEWQEKVTLSVFCMCLSSSEEHAG